MGILFTNIYDPCRCSGCIETAFSKKPKYQVPAPIEYCEKCYINEAQNTYACGHIFCDKCTEKNCLLCNLRGIKRKRTG